MALGYWKDIENSAKKFRKNHASTDAGSSLAVWSGDYGYTDDKGYLYFVGRKDDMIKSQGFRISPTEVEDILYQSGLVSEAVVIVVPHETKGDAIIAFISTTEAEIKSRLLTYCKSAMPNYMLPDSVIPVVEFPRNQNNKIDRKALASQYADGHSK